MQSRERRNDSHDSYQGYTLRLTAYYAAINGGALGFTAGFTLACASALLRGSVGKFNFFTRPFALSAVGAASGYVTTYKSPLTLFLQKRASQQEIQFNKTQKHHEHANDVSNRSNHI